MKALDLKQQMLAHLRSASFTPMVGGLEDGGSTTAAEREYVFYVRLTPAIIEALSKYPCVFQEQWQLRGELKRGIMRVRRETNNGTVKCSATVKVNTSDSHTRIETEQEITPEFFDQFSLVSDKGFIKNRYRIPTGVEGVEWEVDLHFNRRVEGQPEREWDVTANQYGAPHPDLILQPWCRFEVEIPEGMKTTGSLLFPFPSGTDMLRGDDKSEQTQASITKMFDDHFLVLPK